MYRVIGKDGREWVIRREIQWRGKDYGFDVESDDGMEGIIIPCVLTIIFLILYAETPLGVPWEFRVFIFLVAFSPVLFWYLNRHRVVTAISGNECWRRTVRGLKRARRLERAVVHTIREEYLPLELERI